MSVTPSNWSIVQVTPQTPADSFETDTLLVYTDDACTNESRDTSAQVLPMIIITTYYRYRVPLSFKWVRYSTLAPNTTTTTTTHGSTSTHLTKTSTNPSQSTSTSTTTTAVEVLPTATYRPSFQTSILPPKPSHWWNRPCSHNSTSCGPKTDNTTRNVIIVGVTVSLLALGFLAAGAYYIYRSFYSSPDSDSANNITSSDAIFKNTRSNTNALNRMNPNSSSSSSTGDISGYNSSYVYNHDEDESVPPKFIIRVVNVRWDESPGRSSGKSSGKSFGIPVPKRIWPTTSNHPETEALSSNTISFSDFLAVFPQQANVHNNDDWILETKTSVDKALVQFALNLNHEHLVHSFVFDTDCIAAAKSFTKHELGFIRSNSKKKPSLENNYAEYLASFCFTNMEELRRRLEKNDSEAQGASMNVLSTRRWIYATILHFANLID
ncbi:hypothetical protein BGX20_003026, partial [Mortierella sp. AD010]